MTDLEISDVLKFLCRRGDLGYIKFEDEIGNSFIYTLITNKKFYLALVLLNDLNNDYYNKGNIEVFRSINKNRVTGVEETLPLTAHENGDSEFRIVRFYINYIDEFLVEELPKLHEAIKDNSCDSYYRYKTYYRMEPSKAMDHLKKYIFDFEKIILSASRYEEIIAFLDTTKLKYEVSVALKNRITNNTGMFFQLLRDGLFKSFLDLYEDEKELLNTNSLYEKSSFYVDLDEYKVLADKVIENERFRKTYIDENNREYTPLNIIFDKIETSDNHGYTRPLLEHILANEKVDKDFMSKTLVYLFSNKYASNVKEIYDGLVSRYNSSIDNFMNLFNDEIVKVLMSCSIKNIGVDATRSIHYEKVMKLIIKRMISELYNKFNIVNYTVDTTTIVNSYGETFGNRELAEKIYADFLDNFLKMKNNPSLNLDEISQELFDKYCKEKSNVYTKKMK